MTEPRENSADWLKEDVEPTYEGPSGRAWRFVEPPADDNPRHQTRVGDSWLVFAPAAHPLWSWHVIMAVALRDVEGLAPAKKNYSEAEYELMVFALNPERPVPDPRVWPLPGRLSLLEPPDVVLQFDGVTDAQAAEIVGLCARACASGYLVPDSDYRTAWKNSIVTTVSRYAEGRH